MTQARQAHPRGGWREEETTVLFDAVKRAEQEGRPLREAFGDAGAQLGRKPNSIRNYYYALVRELPERKPRKAPFRTFTEEELRALLRDVLLGRAQGESVRACVTRLAGGDRQRMLRYQNKYRSVLKNRPELLREIAAELKAEGRETPPLPVSEEPARAYRTALKLSMESGDRTLGLMLDGLNALLLRVTTAEQAAQAVAPSARVTAELERKWLEARRDADRLRVQTDLLKLQLEDAQRQGYTVTDF